MLDQNAPIYDVPVQLRESIFIVYLKESADLIDKMKQGVRNNDLDSIKSASHKLKGSCVTVGANKLADFARKIEGSTEVEPEVIIALAAEFDVIKSHIQTL
ncbi:MAG: HPt (histidine-containing phosphotransfer) domain-containing protein [Parvicellaceae bacterium]|jgi:HPt (histidine-containing phosphotransfer) domain-containing protein